MLVMEKKKMEDTRMKLRDIIQLALKRQGKLSLDQISAEVRKKEHRLFYVKTSKRALSKFIDSKWCKDFVDSEKIRVPSPFGTRMLRMFFLRETER